MGLPLPVAPGTWGPGQLAGGGGGRGHTAVEAGAFTVGRKGERPGYRNFRLLQAGGSLEPCGAGSHAEVILSPPAWRRGEERGLGGEGWRSRPFPTSAPAPASCGGSPGPQGAPPGRHHPSTAACAPWRGGTAAVARLEALGFINNAAWRWGPAQLWVTHCGIVSSWQSCGRAPLPSSLLLLFCYVSLGQRPSLCELGQGKGV